MKFERKQRAKLAQLAQLSETFSPARANVIRAAIKGNPHARQRVQGAINLLCHRYNRSEAQVVQALYTNCTNRLFPTPGYNPFHFWEDFADAL